YATGKGIVTISSETDSNGRTRSETLVGSDISEISKALAKAREERIATESELANTLTGSAVVNAPTISALRQKRAELSAELARQRAILAEDYPTVVSLKTQLSEIDRSIEQETARSRLGNRQAYDAAVKRERELQGELDQLTQKYNAQQ